MQERLERIRGQFESAALDALLVTSAPNRRYLSGFTGSAGVLLIGRQRTLLLSDGRYAAQGPREAPNFEFKLLGDAAPLARQLPQLVRELHIQRLGFEANTISVAEYTKLQRELELAQAACSFVPTEGLVEKVRQVKDSAELDTLRRAIAITDTAFAAVRPLLRPTMREREVAWELEKAMREHGADGLSFDVIVAAGDNGSRPHARAGNDELGVGRPIVIDFGALLEGYHADMTRTVILGQADEQFWQVYTTVREAQHAAALAARVGMTGAEVDALAREPITRAGYGEAFSHGLGHGVGLEIHEGPSVRSSSQQALQAGMVYSVEPGVYLPGWGGVRIEDLVMLTDAGPEVLTQSSKDPVVEI